MAGAGGRRKGSTSSLPQLQEEGLSPDPSMYTTFTSDVSRHSKTLSVSNLSAISSPSSARSINVFRYFMSPRPDSPKAMGSAFIGDDFEASKRQQSTSEVGGDWVQPTPSNPRDLFDISKTQTQSMLGKERRSKFPVYNKQRASTPFMPKARKPLNLMEGTLRRGDGSTMRASQSVIKPSHHREQAEALSSRREETHRSLPYIVVDPIANKKADRILRAIRHHDYIVQSPQHSKAYAISERGYVEKHDRGLAEFESLSDLGFNMTLYSLACKLPLFRHFKEYKAFRWWDRALRKRKFRDRMRRIEKLFLQSRREYLACMQLVNDECVKLSFSLLDEGPLVPHAGLSLESLTEEVGQRRETVEEAVENLRLKLSDYLESFFTSISSQFAISKLREVYKRNRRGDIEEAISIASEDMHCLGRLYALVENILCENVIRMNINEIQRIVKLFHNQDGVLQMDAFMKLDQEIEVGDISALLVGKQPADCVELVTIPSLDHVTENLTKALDSLHLSLSYSMRPCILDDIDRFIAEEIFSNYSMYKPSFGSTVVNSVDFLSSRQELSDILELSMKQVFASCQQIVGEFKPIFAFLLHLDAATAKFQEKVETFEVEVEHIVRWITTITRLISSDVPCGSIRLKFRRLKSYLQEKVQRDVMDKRFDIFYKFVCDSITELKLVGGKFTQRLDVNVKKFEDVVDLLRAMEEVDGTMEEYISRVYSITRMRETVLTHFNFTSKALEDQSGRINVPVLQVAVAEKIREERLQAQSRFMNRRDAYVELVQQEVKRFHKACSALLQSLKAPEFHDLKSAAESIAKQLEAKSSQAKELLARREMILFAVRHLKLSVSDDQASLEDAESWIAALTAVWKVLASWNETMERVMNTSIMELQETLQVSSVESLVAQAEHVTSSHPFLPVTIRFTHEIRSFQARWQALKPLLDSAITSDSLESILQGKGVRMLMPTNRLTFAMLMEKKLLEDDEQISSILSAARKKGDYSSKLDLLRKSVKTCKLQLCRGQGNLWVKDAERVRTLLQDNQSFFRWVSEMKRGEKDQLSNVSEQNLESLASLTLIHKCQDLWCCFRILRHVKSDELEPFLEAFLGVEALWTSCLEDLGHKTDIIWLSEVKLEDHLRIQEIEQKFQTLRPCLDILHRIICKHFSRLVTLKPREAVSLYAFFLEPGPSLPPSLCRKCFPNLTGIELKDDLQPARVHCEDDEVLVLDESTCQLNTTDVKISNFYHQLKHAVKVAIFQAVESILHSSNVDDLFTNHTLQSIMIAMRLNLTEHYRTSGKEELESHILDTMKGLATYQSDGEVRRSSRRKVANCMMLLMEWRDMEYQDIADHQFLYGIVDQQISVSCGKYTIKYSFNYVNEHVEVLLTASTKRILQKMFASLSSPSLLSLGRAAEGERLIRRVASMCGCNSHVYDCIMHAKTEELLACVRGSMEMEELVCLKHAHFLPSPSLAALAKTIFQTLTSPLQTPEPFSHHVRPQVYLLSDQPLSSSALPIEMRETLRPVDGVCWRQDKRFLFHLFLKSSNPRVPDVVVSKIEQAHSLVQLLAMEQERQRVNIRFVRVLCDAVAAKCLEGATSPSSEEGQVELALKAFLQSLRLLLSTQSYERCCLGIEAAMNYSIPESSDAGLYEGIRTLSVEEPFAFTETFVERCVSLYHCVTSDVRMTLLSGATKAGKTTSMEVVKKMMLSMSQTNDRKSYGGCISTTVMPFSFPYQSQYFSPSCGPPGGIESMEVLHDYISRFLDRPVDENFPIESRWMIIDMPSTLQLEVLADGLDQHCFSRDFAGGGMRPKLLVETDEMGSASPATISLLNVLHYEEGVVGWREYFHQWMKTVQKQLDDKVVNELNHLVESLFPEIETFIRHNCQLYLYMSTVNVCRCFCSILHYHIFLGKAVPYKRSISFCRSCFIFAVAWSWGSLLQVQSRGKFAATIKQMVLEHDLLSDAESGLVDELWNVYVSFETMKLRKFDEMGEDIVAEEKISYERDTALIIRTPVLRVCDYLWNMFRFQQDSVFIYGAESEGKTTLMTFMASNRRRYEADSQVSGTRLTSSTTPLEFCKWVESEASPSFAVSKKILLVIDDVHVSLERCGETSYISEMLRSVQLSRAFFKADSFEDEKRFQAVCTTLIGDLRSLTRKSDRLLTSFFHLEIRFASLPNLHGILSQKVSQAEIWRFPKLRPYLDKFTFALMYVLNAAEQTFTSGLSSSKRVLLTWNVDQVVTVMQSFNNLKLRSDKDIEFGLQYLWHEASRVFLDRLLGSEVEQEVGLRVRECFVKALGSQNKRNIRIACEAQVYFVTLPELKVKDTGDSNRRASTKVVSRSWETLELTGRDMLTRAENTLTCSRDCSHLLFLDNLVKHLSHVLRVLRPDSRMRCCVMAGPREAGKEEVLRMAARMCHYEICFETDSNGLDVLQELKVSLHHREHKLFVLQSDGLLLQSVHGEYVSKLIKGQGLERWEALGSRHVRIAITMNFVESEEVVRVPEQLVKVLPFASVSWCRGWSDESLRSFASQQTLKVSSTCSTPEVIHDLHKIFQRATMRKFSLSSKQLSCLDPLMFTLVHVFKYIFSALQERFASRKTTIRQALETYQKLQELQSSVEMEYDNQKKIVKQTSAAQSKWRDDTMQFRKIVQRARKIAEDEEIEMLRSVLEGDAPGPELSREFYQAQIQLQAATKAVANLSEAHYMQLELVQGHEELLELLHEALCACLRIPYEPFESDRLNHLKSLCPQLSEKISSFELQAMSMHDLQRLRKLSSNKRFIPEKFFVINKAAGALVHWVRSVELLGRLNEWMNPNSHTNQHQSLDQVQRMARLPLMTMNQVESEVENARATHLNAIREESEAKEKMQKLRRVLESCSLVLEILADDQNYWKEEEEELSREEQNSFGDALLYACFHTYLGLFDFQGRQRLLDELKQHLLQSRIEVSSEFSIDNLLKHMVAISESFVKFPQKSSSVKELVFTVFNSPKIPLFVDASGLMWYFMSTYCRASVFRGNDASLEDFLTLAKDKAELVLLSDVEVERRTLLSLLERRPDLRPEAFGLGEKQYALFFFSRLDLRSLDWRKDLTHFTVCCCEFDQEATEELMSDLVLETLDPSAKRGWMDYHRQLSVLQNQLRGKIEAIRDLICHSDFIADIQEAESSATLDLCQSVKHLRKQMQDYVVASAEKLKNRDYLSAFSRNCSSLLRAAPETSRITGVFDSSIHQLRQALGLMDSVDSMEYGTKHFSDVMSKQTDEIVAAWLSLTFLALPDSQFGLVSLVCLAHVHGRPFNKVWALWQAATRALHEAGEADLCSLGQRECGPQQMFSRVGWRVLREMKEQLGVHYDALVMSIEHDPGRWRRYVESQALSLDSFPFKSSGSISMPLEKVVVCAMALMPHRLNELLDVLTGETQTRVWRFMEDNRVKLSQYMARLDLNVSTFRHGASALAYTRIIAQQLHSLDPTSSSPARLELQHEGDTDGGSRKEEGKHDRWVVTEAPDATWKGEGGSGRVKLVRVWDYTTSASFKQLKNSMTLSDGMMLLPPALLQAMVHQSWARRSDAPFWRFAVGLSYFLSLLLQTCGKMQAQHLFDMVPIKHVHVTLLCERMAEWQGDKVRLVMPKLIGSHLRHQVEELADSILLHVVNFLGDVAMTWQAQQLEGLYRSIICEKLFGESESLTVLDNKIAAPDAHVASQSAMIAYALTLPPLHPRTLDSLTIKYEWSTEEAILRALPTPLVHLANLNISRVLSKLDTLVMPNPLVGLASLLSSLMSFLQTQGRIRGGGLQSRTALLMYEAFVGDEMLAHNTVVETITERIKACKLLLSGRAKLSESSGLVQALARERVPASWDVGANKVGMPISRFLEQVKERGGWLQTCISNLNQASIHANSPAVPLHLHYEPGHLFDMLLALNHNSDRSDAAESDISLMLYPLKDLDDLARSWPQACVLALVYFRRTKFDADEGVLRSVVNEQDASLHPAERVCVMVCKRSSMPLRRQMKKEGLSWCSIRLYRYPLHPRLYGHASLQYVCNLVVRTDLHPSRVDELGVCAFLSSTMHAGDGLQ
ncbi:hypothetical protein GUITHDRAFT_102984 [Guillardia theta CCMP2712]|uniref:Dynein heavy chain linker domain-containing protein n=3 Tax=Guillardia theta TaxID=55529 RepID=L1JRW8_GUITC|nr:hypothetical protein GUITHDRAFT_102984 [Guillardia theta CCMP2712]EKX51059.1 hypothetical protein GUITHDRAFT_102984 [Guillardia theta CCMP2712]|eukprot:XP_005838039.1 hypothetical protein GUITHDRAFT_102984 [Guillardia theta CCMP2712]